MDDILIGSLSAASRALAKRDVSAVELCTAILLRIETLDRDYHSYATVEPEIALGTALRVDDARAANTAGGTLAGIPLGLKDIIATTDMPTNVGGLALRQWQPGLDSTVAARLRGAGAVLLGKHQTTEAACGAHHPSVTPPVNPFNPNAWTGVSSSGSAVATAAGLSFGSFGSDTGGSIRFPSQCCGVVGLKPTWGRISRHGIFPLAETFDHVGPFARTVEDTAVLFEAVAGLDVLDSTSLGARVEPWSASKSDPRGLRIGFDDAYCNVGLHEQLIASLRQAAMVLRDAGAEIVPITVPRLDDAASDWLTICAVQAAQVHSATYPVHASQYGPALRALIDFGLKFEVEEIAQAEHRRERFARSYNALFNEVDVFLSPVFYDPTPSVEEASRLMRGDGMRRFVAFTAPANMSGNPTLSLPGGLDASGTPFGYQLVGRMLGEHDLFRAGYAIQQSTIWPTAMRAL